MALVDQARPRAARCGLCFVLRPPALRASTGPTVAQLYGFAPGCMDVFWKAPNGSLMDT
jgi:hypothetical protein